MFENIDPDYALLVGIIVVCGAAASYVFAVCNPSIRRIERANNARRDSAKLHKEAPRERQSRPYDPYVGHYGCAVITTFVTNLTGYGLNADHFDIVRLAFRERSEYMTLAEMVYSTSRRLGLDSIMNHHQRETLVEELRKDEKFILACTRHIGFLTEATDACLEANKTVVTIPTMYIPNANIIMAFHRAYSALRPMTATTGA